MAQFFGEYLVEQGAISQADLIDALVEQVKSTPSVFEVVHSQNLMSCEDILQILKFQHDNEKEFVSSSKELGFWNQDIRAKVTKEISKVKYPLGKVLLSRGKLEVSQLISHLDEFLGDRIEEIETEQKNAKEAEPSDAVPAETKTQNPALELVPPVAEDGGVSAGEYMDSLNEAKYIELEALILSIEPLKESIGEDVGRVMVPFRALAETLAASNLAKSLGQFNHILSVLEAFEKQAKDYEEGLYWEFKAVAKGALDILWEMRGVMADGKTEADFVAIEGREAAMVDLEKDWQELREKLTA